MVRDDKLDDEIKKAENRLRYLMHRKKTGFPGGRVTKNPHCRVKKKVVEDPEKKFYELEIKNYMFVDKYKRLQESAVQAGKMFSMYHSRVWNAVNKYGTIEERTAFTKLFNKKD
jgi:hypothetical protein